jgi:flagellar assembly protein FliH
MSCKVLESVAEGEIQALPWLRKAAPARRPVRTGDPAGAGDAARLRAQLDELTAGMEQKVRAAAEQAFREGENTARQKLEAQSRAALEKLAAGILSVEQERTDALRRAESDAVRLAVEIARRVLHRELSVDPGALEGLVKAALEKLVNHEILRVRVHPALEKLLAESLARTSRSKSIEVVADPSQPPGGVVFEISRGALDASLDTQLREIERGLIDELRTRT